MRPPLLVLLFVASYTAVAQDDSHWRPTFHFTPPAKWMNDPNGLVYHKGTYHLFYQYYPDDIVWGPMHWGHAESTDLLHWKHLPIALYPDSLGWIFSGSAVIDKENTARFGKDAMVAVFTYHNDAIWKSGRKNTESQGIAYSIDQGKTWTKYKHNPVLYNSGEQDFRDPKVFWNPGIQRWNMVLAAGDRIKIFSSPNLKHWNFESDFIPVVKEPFGVWECPDLFPMKVGAEEKWVLILSQNMNGPNGGSATRYIVGGFNGHKFTAWTDPQWIDHGMDYYAAVTFDNVRNKRILLGWMSNWLYATKTPTKVWRSAMALPRELVLEKLGDSFALRQVETSAFEGIIVGEMLNVNHVSGFWYPGLDFSQAVIQFDLSGQEKLRLKLSNATGEQLEVITNGKELRLDRSRSGVVDFSSDFAAKVQVMQCTTEITQVELILDRSSVEIIVNGGTHWLTALVFPNRPYGTLNLEGATVRNLKVSKISP